MKTAIIQPIQFNNYWDEKRQRHHFRELARQEFETARAIARAESDFTECEPFSVDEERGFEDGFVDYLLYGGMNTPPPLPPRRYWRLKYQNQDGYLAIQEWYNGYQHGAIAAQASGYRNFVTIETNGALIKDTLPIYSGPLPGIEQIEPGQSRDETSPGKAAEKPAAESGLLPSPSASDSSGSRRNARLATASKTDSDSPPGDGELPALHRQASTHADRPNRIRNVLPTTNPTPPEILGSPNTRRFSENGRASLKVNKTQSNPEIPQVTETELPEVTQPPNAPSGFRQQGNSSRTQPPSMKNLPPLEQIRAPVDPAIPSGSTSEPSKFEESPTYVPSGRRDQATPDSFSVHAADSPPNVAPFASVAPASRDSIPWAPATSNRKFIPPTALISHSEVDFRFSERSSKLAKLWLCTGFLLSVGSILFLARRRRVHPSANREIARQLRAGLSFGLRFILAARAIRVSKRRQPEARLTSHLSTQVQSAVLMAVLSTLASGCAALTNPVLNGIPVRRLPTELLTAPHREHLQTIPLSLLKQPQPEDYVLGAGDVIGVFIPGVFPLTLADQELPTPPVYFPSQIDPLGAGLPPSLGYPVTIQNNGMLALPLVEPILLEGLTVEEANRQVREAYEGTGILQAGREAVLVTLMQPRQIRVLIFRQEVGGFAAGGRGDISSNNVKQGTGHIVDLRAYENDVLTAMARSGGLPGLDSFDGIFVFRGGQSNSALTEKLRSLKEGEDLSVLAGYGVPTDYIPTRWSPDEPLPFQPEDVILREGDVVFLEARSKDFFYTGGLLPVGEQVLPRDYDLDVLEAVAQVRGTLINGAFGGNNFTGVLIQQGIGNPNPSALTVIRKSPSGGLIPIRVDLNRALTDPRERILIQPDDVLILQETAGESIARYLNDIINFNVTIFQRGGNGAAATAPGAGN